MTKKLIVLVIWAAFGIGISAQTTKKTQVDLLLEQRDKILSDLNEKTLPDFFTNENLLLEALGPAISKTKDKAAKAELCKLAKMCFDNLYVGATQYTDADPTFARRLLDSYFKASESKALAGAGLTVNPDAYFVYAVGLQSADGSKEKIADFYSKALTSSYGATACQQLVALCHDSGDKAGEEKYLLYGYEHFPGQLQLGIDLIMMYVSDQKYNEAVKYADGLIQRLNNGTITEKTTDTEWYPYYLKATALFNSQQYDKAYDAFVDGDTACPGHIEIVVGAGTAAAKHATMNHENTAVSHPWYQKAIQYLKKAEKAWPKNPEEWGYRLYSCYHNLGDAKMEKKYKKYAR